MTAELEARLLAIGHTPERAALLARLETERLATPRTLFARTSCSQCGHETGPGYHGFSYCEDHRS